MYYFACCSKKSWGLCRLDFGIRVTLTPGLKVTQSGSFWGHVA